MDMSGCIPVTCVSICGNSFYFQVESLPDVDGDSFTTTTRCFNYFIRNKDSKFLLFHENQFEVQNLSSEEQCQLDCKFKIQTYINIPGGKDGMAAILYVKVKDKNMVACCSQEGIYAEEMETLPSHIEGSSHRAIFYMTKLTGSNAYMFESSQFPSKFLVFKPGEDSSVIKLALQQGKDEVDESCEAILEKMTQSTANYLDG